MTNTQLKKLSKSLQEAILSLESTNEIFSFLRDLLTEQEIVEFSQRLDIAQRLYEKQPYKQIEKETGASSTTVARVAKFLHGKNKGYLKVFQK